MAPPVSSPRTLNVVSPPSGLRKLTPSPGPRWTPGVCATRPPSSSGAGALPLDARLEAHPVDHEALVATLADALALVLHLRGEGEPPAVDLLEPHPGHDLHPTRRRGRVAQVDVHAHGELARLQV